MLEGISEARLREVVESSRNIGECLDKFGIVRGGKTYTMFRAICQSRGIELSFPDNYASQRKIPDEEVFVKNSPYVNRRLVSYRVLLKQRLLNKGWKNECAICGQGPVWNGLPLVLQLDHINGVNNDHRIENLRILCPNCHTQTDTFAGKRRQKEM